MLRRKGLSLLLAHRTQVLKVAFVADQNYDEAWVRVFAQFGKPASNALEGRVPKAVRR